MPLFENPFALQIPVRIGYFSIVFYVNQNLHVISSEVNSVPHNHHDYELRYVASGTCKQVISGEMFTVSKGGCLVTKPLEYHWQSWSPQSPDSVQYNLRFSIKDPTKSNEVAVEAYERFLRLLSEIRVLQDESGKLGVLFELLTDEIYHQKYGIVQTIKAICAQIIVELIRMSGQEIKIFPTEELKYHGHERLRLDQFFLAKYLTNVRIQDLAKEMNVSVRQVNYIMHKLYGMSFLQKLTEMRLQHALTQLTYTDEPIASISRSCGFQNPNYFAKCFQKLYSVTPTDYRKTTQQRLR